MEAVLDSWAKVEQAEIKRIEAKRRLDEKAQAQASDGN
jgi:hypothetical protein